VSEQGNVMPEGNAAPAVGERGAGEGMGGSEADRLEQLVALDEGAPTDGVGIAGEGTGGSEADRLEQAADLPLDAEDAFRHGGGDDDAS